MLSVHTVTRKERETITTPPSTRIPDDHKLRSKSKFLQEKKIRPSFLNLLSRPTCLSVMRIIIPDEADSAFPACSATRVTCTDADLIDRMINCTSIWISESIRLQIYTISLLGMIYYSSSADTNNVQLEAAELQFQQGFVSGDFASNSYLECYNILALFQRFSVPQGYAGELMISVMPSHMPLFVPVRGLYERCGERRQD